MGSTNMAYPHPILVRVLVSRLDRLIMRTLDITTTSFSSIKLTLQKLWFDTFLIDIVGTGPAQELVEKPFFETIARALKLGGVLCNQAESMWLHTHLIQDMLTICRETFKGSVHYASTSVPTYPSGTIGFLLCSKEGHPVNFLNPINPIEKQEGAIKAGREIKYYNTEMHRAAFALPSFTKRELTTVYASLALDQPKQGEDALKTNLVTEGALVTAS